MQNQKDCPCPQKLYRSETNQIIAGVAGGMGKRYQIDPNIIRIVFVLLGFLFGLGVIIYLLLWIFLPVQSQTQLPETRVIQSNVKSFNSHVKSWSEILAGCKPLPSKKEKNETKTESSKVEIVAPATDGGGEKESERGKNFNSLKIIISIVVIIVGLVVLVAGGIGFVEFFAFEPLILLLIIAFGILLFLIR
jgi:phage shock protein PspC (stress-responsive transcriptional regulator)